MGNMQHYWIYPCIFVTHFNNLKSAQNCLKICFHLITQAPLDVCLENPGIMYGLSVLEVLCRIRTDKNAATFYVHTVRLFTNNFCCSIWIFQGGGIFSHFRLRLIYISKNYLIFYCQNWSQFDFGLSLSNKHTQLSLRLLSCCKHFIFLWLWLHSWAHHHHGNLHPLEMRCSLALALAPTSTHNKFYPLRTLWMYHRVRNRIPPSHQGLVTGRW